MMARNTNAMSPLLALWDWFAPCMTLSDRLIIDVWFQKAGDQWVPCLGVSFVQTGVEPLSILPKVMDCKDVHSLNTNYSLAVTKAFIMFNHLQSSKSRVLYLKNSCMLCFTQWSLCKETPASAPTSGTSAIVYLCGNLSEAPWPWSLRAPRKCGSV